MAQIIQFPTKARPSCCVMGCGIPATCYLELCDAESAGGNLVKYFCDDCIGNTEGAKSLLRMQVSND